MDVVGFAAQGGNSTATMQAVAPVRFPVLVFLGLSTFERVLQCRSKTSPSASGSTAGCRGEAIPKVDEQFPACQQLDEQ